MGTRLTRVASACLLFGLELGTTRLASAAGPIDLRGETTFVDAGRLDALVQLELGALAGGVDEIVVDLAKGRASVTIRRGQERLRGSLPIPDSGDVERALALFVGELARGNEPPGAEPASPAPVPISQATSRPAAERAPASPSTPPAPRAPDAEPMRFAALATAGLRAIPAGGALLLSPRVEVGVHVPRRLRLGLVARYARASADDTLGVVTADAFTGGAAATWTLATLDRLAIAAGPRVEVGAIAGRGEGTNGTRTTKLALTGAIEAELRLRVASRFGVFLTAEGGYYARGVELRADDRAVLSVEGAFAGGSIGVGL